MRRLVLAGSVVLACMALSSSGRAEPPRENVILLDVGLHVIGAGYQRTLRPWVSAQLALDAYLPWTQNQHLLEGGDEPETDVTGVILRHRLFFYPQEDAPAGLWISPFGQLGVVSATRGEEKKLGSAFAGGMSLGYSFLIAGRVLAGLGVGAQVHAAHILGGEGSPSFGGVYPQIDGNLGYAF